MNDSLYALAAIVLLNVLDVLTTMHVLSKGGREINPMVSWMIGKLGIVPALLVVKVFALGVLYSQLAVIPMYILLIIFAVYVAVLANNVHAMLKK